MLCPPCIILGKGLCNSTNDAIWHSCGLTSCLPCAGYMYLRKDAKMLTCPGLPRHNPASHCAPSTSFRSLLRHSLPLYGPEQLGCTLKSQPFDMGLAACTTMSAQLCCKSGAIGLKLALLASDRAKEQIACSAHQGGPHCTWRSTAVCMETFNLPVTCIWIVNGKAIALGHVSPGSALAGGIGRVAAGSGGGP